MKIIITRRGSWFVASLSGELDIYSVSECRAEIERNLKCDQIRGIVFDLTNLSFIDSSGLGFILGRYHQFTEHGVQTMVAGAQGQVERVLKMSGFDKLMLLCGDISQAIEMIEG